MFSLSRVVVSSHGFLLQLVDRKRGNLVLLVLGVILLLLRVAPLRRLLLILLPILLVRQRGLYSWPRVLPCVVVADGILLR